MDEDTNCESLLNLDEQLDDEFVDNQLEMNELERTKLTKLTKSDDNHATVNESIDQSNELMNKDQIDSNSTDKSNAIDDHNNQESNLDSNPDSNLDNCKNNENNQDNQNDVIKKSRQSGKHDHHSVLVVHLLNGGKFECDVTSKSTGKDVFHKTCDYLILREFEYFGLTYRDAENVRIWINLDKKILKQIKDNPNSLHFEVKFFPEPTDLKENITRFFLSLQIRNNIVQEKITCSDETYALLGSFLVQSEFGNFDPDKHQDDYLNDFKFAPKPTAELINRLKELHKERKGLTAPEAELQFLQNAKKLSIYGLDFYPAKDANNESIKIGVCSSGLSVYKLSVCLESYPWLKINKISYNVDTFFIKIKPNDDKEKENAENTINFKMCSAKQAYDLWKITVEHHTFFKSLSNSSSLSTSNKKSSSRKNSKDQLIKSSKSSKRHHHHHHRHKTSSKTDKDLKSSSQKDRTSKKETLKSSSTNRKHKLDKLKSSKLDKSDKIDKLDKLDKQDKLDKLDASSKHNSRKEYTSNHHHNEQSYKDERYRSDRDRNDLKDDYLNRDVYSSRNHSKDKYHHSDVRDRPRQLSPSRHKRKREDDRNYYNKEEKSYRDGDSRAYRNSKTYQESRDNGLSNDSKRRKDYDRDFSNQEKEHRNRSDRDYKGERSERTTMNRSPLNRSSRSNLDKSESRDKSRRHKHKSKHHKNETKSNEKTRNQPISIAESHYQSLENERRDSERSIKYHQEDKVSKSKEDKKHKHKKSRKSNDENKSPVKELLNNNKDDKKISNHFIKDIIDLDNSEEKSLNDNHQIVDMDTSDNEASKSSNNKETLNTPNKPKKDAKLGSKSNVEFDIFWDNEDNQSTAKPQQQQDQQTKSKEDGKQDKSFIPRVLLNGNEVNSRSTFKFELKSIRTGPKTPPDDFNIFETTLSNQSIPTPTQDESQVCLNSDKFNNNSSHVDSLNANSVRSLSPSHSMQSEKSQLNDDNLVEKTTTTNNQPSNTLNNNHNANKSSSSKFEIYDPERPLDSPPDSHNNNQTNNFNSTKKSSSFNNSKSNYNKFTSNSSSTKPNGDSYTDRPPLDIDSPFLPSKPITNLNKPTQQPKASTSSNNNVNNNSSSLNNNNQPAQNQFDLKLVLDHLIKAAQMQQQKKNGGQQANDGQFKKQQTTLDYRNDNADDNDNMDYDDMPSSAVELNLRDKYIKKLNRQERVVDEVKCHLKPYYQRKEVTKEEYKNIMRKAVPKICHSKTGEINPHKIQQLVESYIKKEKQARKK